jgi:hypothetical protein
LINKNKEVREELEAKVEEINELKTSIEEQHAREEDLANQITTT